MTILTTTAVVALTVLSGWAPAAAREEGVGGPTAARAEQGAGCESGPVAVVVQFLGLRTDQLPALQQMLQERQQAVAPLLQEIAMREQRIRELIAGGGEPSEIGVLVLQIHQLRQQVENAQGAFLARFEGLLDTEQRVRWQHVRMAARVSPVVPAFQALQML